jgi:prepilin-type N-terminal cleavage/methylation domain-containing protein
MKKYGFTILELMVVVAIICLLAMVSVPQYFNYLAKAKQAEASLNLASLHTAMQAYYAENGRYTTVLGGPEGIGWKPAGYKQGGKDESFLYTYGFNVSSGQEGIHYFTGKLETPASSLGDSYADAESFVASAAADITGKGIADVWQVDETKRIENTQKGV